MDGGDERARATYLFSPDEIRSAQEPPDTTTRLVWMFLALLRRHEFDFRSYAKEFRRGEKTFRRDVAKLRELGEAFDFELTRNRKGPTRLAKLGSMPDTREKATALAADTLAAVSAALGELVSRDIRNHVDLSAVAEPFLRIASPRLTRESHVAEIFAFLRDAASRKARVRFRYRSALRNVVEERIVEPHLVSYYDGRYYLVAYDARPQTHGWRQFCLDRIEGTPALAGTFDRRAIPSAYDGADALGLFKTGPSTEVVIELAPAIAMSVVARSWQRNQRVLEHGDGSATIAFDVYDLGEAVRWAFGFGTYARVVGPQAAVDFARDLALELAMTYATSQERSTVS